MEVDFVERTQSLSGGLEFPGSMGQTASPRDARSGSFDRSTYCKNAVEDATALGQLCTKKIFPNAPHEGVMARLEATSTIPMHQAVSDY